MDASLDVQVTSAEYILDEIRSNFNAECDFVYESDFTSDDEYDSDDESDSDDEYDSSDESTDESTDEWSNENNLTESSSEFAHPMKYLMNL